MKNSLFKKREITKKDASSVLGGAEPTQYQQDTIGMKQTLRYVVPWGGVRDDHASTDTQTVHDNV